jgi:histidinol dehydrogenase
MKRINYPSRESWAELMKRPSIDNKVLVKTVGKILQDVKKGGDSAVRKYTKKFDGIALRSAAIKKKDFVAAEKMLSYDLISAIKQASENINKFHQVQKETINVVETTKGVVCWRKSMPIERVGIYIPGGSAPLFSSILMLAIPAQVAGCREIVLCTPPSRDGNIHPAILYTAGLMGITEIHPYGGVQAIAAMAYGTKKMKKVDKIFGPGNQYVTMAKQLVQLDGVAIDMPAGPSEVCVLADSTSNPDFIAADLLSQAEHGADSQVVLISDSQVVIEKTLKSISSQLNLLERKDIAAKALDNSLAILVHTMDEGIALVNHYAAEHLILASDRANEIAEKIEHAGSVFLGNHTPESAGDYASGTNHTLPTNGFARAYSGVSVDSFIRKVTFQQISPEGLQLLGKTIITMAEAEGLDAHANAVKIRIKQ